MYPVQYKMYPVQYKMYQYSTKCTRYSTKCTRYSTKCTQYRSKCTQYSTRWRFLLFHSRGVNTPLSQLRATTVLTASYIFGNRSREDGHTVNQIGLDYQGFESRSSLKRPISLQFPGLKRPGRQLTSIYCLR